MLVVLHRLLVGEPHLLRDPGRPLLQLRRRVVCSDLRDHRDEYIREHDRHVHRVVEAALVVELVDGRVDVHQLVRLRDVSVVVVERREVGEDLLLVQCHERLVTLHVGQRAPDVVELVRFRSELDEVADGLVCAEQLTDPPLIERRGLLVDRREHLLVLLSLLDLGPLEVLAFADDDEAALVGDQLVRVCSHVREVALAHLLRVQDAQALLERAPDIGF